MNTVANYSFSEGRLKGLGLGGAYRWQDKIAVGYPFIQDANGDTVGDVKHPIYAPAEGSVDLFASYKMPFFQK